MSKSEVPFTVTLHTYFNQYFNISTNTHSSWHWTLLNRIIINSTRYLRIQTGNFPANYWKLDSHTGPGSNSDIIASGRYINQWNLLTSKKRKHHLRSRSTLNTQVITGNKRTKRRRRLLLRWLRRAKKICVVCEKLSARSHFLQPAARPVRIILHHYIIMPSVSI